MVMAAGWLTLSLVRVASTRRDRALAFGTAGAAASYLVMSLALTMLPYGTPNALLALMLGVTAGRLALAQPIEASGDDGLAETTPRTGLGLGSMKKGQHRANGI